jgi:uncharacterized protein (TIGR02421 family)
MTSTGRPPGLALRPHDAAERAGAAAAPPALRDLVERLREEERVVATLPAARVHLDRHLPYLLVHRGRDGEDGGGATALVRGEASYLVLERGHDADEAAALVRALVEAGARAFGAFLLLELWAGEAGTREYHVQGPREEGAETVAALADALRTMRGGPVAAEVVVESTTERHPPGLSELISPRDARDLACLSLGLEVPPVWRGEGGETYPVFLRTFKRAFSRALRQGIHEFIRVQTTAGIEDYRMLGPTRIEPRTLEADAELAAIEESYPFLLLVSPVNEVEAWRQFRAGRHRSEPEFTYRLLPVDPDLLKRRLYAVPLEQVEDPAMAFLLRDKRDELDRQISMLADHGTPAFRAGSERLYGALDDETLAAARAILRDVPAPVRPAGPPPRVEAYAFAERARREIEHYRALHPALTSTVTVRDDIVGLLVSRGQLMVGESLDVRAERVEPLIQHEVGTHVLTFANGAAQPLKQLRYGLAGYDELQEGLAVLAEYLVGGLTADRLRLLAARVIGVHALLQGASFLETFRLLRGEHGFGRYSSFSVAARVHQSGGFTRDMIYLRGLVRVMRHLERGEALEPLYIGKIAEKHIPVIEELRTRGVLREPPLRPRFLRDVEAQRRLDAVRRGLPVSSLVSEQT